MQVRVYTNVPAALGADFLKEKKDLVLLDVRQPEEYEAGHIPGAVLIPLGELESRIDELDKEKEYLVICRSGRRSVMACHLLNERGFDKLFNLQGGMLEWTAEVTRSQR
ncbi:rhodanese-like domain-containing protein [Effusibacillus lacus]|uniref:Sulfurtransferase n=1 Tax=Effusibacillus lacus TaxID=1348429 RepID=A0A292YRV7_9BACL|nr:rhodanese-like domain-containing protein [Effusibacillus lacus]TCS76813.1 rhodanese-related sulfurtransferase [Effusibacillus lacus]GAX91144.1 sulfurtransferase [Effusibacillus lacus]